MKFNSKMNYFKQTAVFIAFSTLVGADKKIPPPFCPMTSEVIKFGGGPEDDNLYKSTSLDSITDEYTHNMRPTAFKCC